LLIFVILEVVVIEIVVAIKALWAAVLVVETVNTKLNKTEDFKAKLTFSTLNSYRVSYDHFFRKQYKSLQDDKDYCGKKVFSSGLKSYSDQNGIQQLQK